MSPEKWSWISDYEIGSHKTDIAVGADAVGDGATISTFFAENG